MQLILFKDNASRAQSSSFEIAGAQLILCAKIRRSLRNAKKKPLFLNVFVAKKATFAFEYGI